MTSAASPKISRERKFPLIWIVPLIALGIGLWMAYSELHNRGPMITIDFADGSGVEAGKTTLEYKGVASGTVQKIVLKKNLDGVTVYLRLRRNAEALAASDSKFWIVHPEIGFSGVHGLETLVTGVHLNVEPGKGQTGTHFTGLDRTPAPDVTDEGRAFILKSDRLGSLTTGAPIFYRELKVGAVEASRLSEDSTSVLIRIHIEAPYVNLVRTNTRFWNTGGFSFKVSLFGAQLKDTSLESLVTGGVAFATSDKEPLGAVADADTHFDLAADADKEWMKWAPKIPVNSPESVVEKRTTPGLLPGLIK
jgi:paraquat-inducible protein B